MRIDRADRLQLKHGRADGASSYVNMWRKATPHTGESELYERDARLEAGWVQPMRRARARLEIIISREGTS